MSQRSDAPVLMSDMTIDTDAGGHVVLRGVSRLARQRRGIKFAPQMRTPFMVAARIKHDLLITLTPLAPTPLGSASAQ